MEKYIQQLLQDIELIILYRWQTVLPHYYEAGIPSPYLNPPKGWKEEISDDISFDAPDVDLSLLEMEAWLEDQAEHSMYSHFDLEPVQFPPPERLTDEQLDKLTFMLHRLWNAFNFTAVTPEKAPSRVVYPILLKRMLEPAMVLNHGHIGIEFCDYEAEGCVFGEFCSCKDYENEFKFEEEE